MSLLSPTIDRLHCLVDEDADHNMLQDLQLAAELGKTLLERNKELENTIRSQQDKIEEQAHEIEYMKKQTTALREVNDSRLRIYEQLEVSIQDLERANHLLVVDNANDKKLLKTQSMTIENLEIKCEDIHKKFDDIKSKYQILVRQQSTNEEVQDKVLWKNTPDGSINKKATSTTTKSTSNVNGNTQEYVNSISNDEEVTSLLKQLNEVRSQRAREQKKISDLEIQLSSIVHENNALEEQLNVWRNKAQDVKNLQDELSTLEEVRQGHLCGRCLRGINMRSHEELTLMMDRNGPDIPEDDEISLPGTFINGVNGHSNCLLQDINSKMGLMDQIQDNYELIFKEDKDYNSHSKTTALNTCMSLQEELRMSGEFNNFQNATSKKSDNHVGDKTAKEKTVKIMQKGGKKFSGTPTDFSEAETLSSGFSDETINKSTQTDGRPGSLLCSIADGDNCKLSIYDDNSTFESRFNHTPEYRQIFSEIVSALKRAAEAKEENDKLPQNNVSDISNISSNYSFATDGTGGEETDDTQSVMSSTICSVVSEPIFKPNFSNKERHKPDLEKNTETPIRPQHHRRQPLDYLSIQTRKKSAKKNSPKKYNVEPHSTPDVIPTINPKFTHAKSNSGGKRRFRPLTNTDLESGVWNGYTTHFYSSKKKDSRSSNSHSKSPNNQNNTSFEYKDYKPSVASQEIAKLKKLDMSYAEVLRMPNKPKGNNMRRSS
ncbi:uncharacterized protein LOC127278958 isoform X2 [Leptopilina boulardi]|uniref:uncharacterized protein LOC127278958 isoform X2 n=1 Tax=Leptopilina boulardi TaxID=63433 RepID=UPI0021F67EAE|nr:uncharacterized protein LOC127278958 isoform X2 [Leptopilina boulardi]